MKFYLFVLVISFISNVAAYGAILPISTEIDVKNVANLTAQNVSDDLDLLLEALSKAYGGKPVLSESEYQSLILGIENLKVNSNDYSSQTFCEALSEVLARVPDNHLGASLGYSYCGEEFPVASVGENSGLGTGNPTWSLVKRTIGDKTVNVLSMLKMTQPQSSDYKDFLETVSSLNNSNKAFVIDLRGNSGGNIEMGRRMARILYGITDQKFIPSPKKEIFRFNNPEAWSLLANSFWIDIQRLKFRGRDVPQYLYDTYQDLVATRQQVIDAHEPELLIQSIGQAEIDLANAFAQPIYILIDRDCGSSCELLVEALERLPKVQTVGEATSGTVQFGNRGSLYLPNSHIVVDIPIQGAKYFDGRKVEKIGYSPRWPVDSGSDALDFTLDRFFK